MNVGVPNPGRAEAGGAAQDHASREVVREGLHHGTGGGIVRSPEAAHAPASAVAAVVTLLRDALAVGGAMAAVPPNAHHRAAFAMDGRRTASVLGTIKESAILSTLATLLLLSPQKEEARKGLLDGLRALSEALGLIHRIPTTIRISLSMVTANGQCRADANSARTASTLTRLTALLLLALARRGATIVRTDRVRLPLKSHLEVSLRGKSPRLRSDHHLQGKRSPLAKDNAENLAERTTSAGLDPHLPVWRTANSMRRTLRVRLLMMTPLLNMTIYILCLHTHTRVLDEKCDEEVSVTTCFVCKFTRHACSSILPGL